MLSRRQLHTYFLQIEYVISKFSDSFFIGVSSLRNHQNAYTTILAYNFKILVTVCGVEAGRFRPGCWISLVLCRRKLRTLTSCSVCNINFFYTFLISVYRPRINPNSHTTILANNFLILCLRSWNRDRSTWMLVIFSPNSIRHLNIFWQFLYRRLQYQKSYFGYCLRSWNRNRSTWILVIFCFSRLSQNHLYHSITYERDR